MPSRRLGTRAAVAALTVSALMVAAPAAAARPWPPRPPGLSGPVVLSGPSPFTGCTADPAPDAIDPNTEVEPVVAVDPRNPARFAAIWQQDRRAFGNARGIVVATTTDGGSSWRSTALPGFSACSGGTENRSGSPWVSFGARGTLYATAGSFSRPGHSTVVLSRSDDGGGSWTAPTVLISDDISQYWNDKPSVTADPYHARYVYVTWNRGYIPLARHEVMLARSTDGGRTFAPPRPIYQVAPDGAGTFGNQIVVLRNGTLLDLTLEKAFPLGGPPAAGIPTRILVRRSTDHGVTWSAPVTVSQHTISEPSVPDSGGALPTTGINPDIAVDPVTGTVYVVWSQKGLSAADSDVALAASRDGGRHWSAPVRVNRTPATEVAADGQAFLPQVDVAGDGTVGVTYYDFRSNTPDPGVPTDVWIGTCRGRRCATGAGWRERHLAGPFDLTTATVWNGPYVGSYAGLGHTRRQFLAVFPATTGDPANRQDIVLAPARIC